jgi:hypothetical protein
MVGWLFVLNGKFVDIHVLFLRSRRLRILYGGFGVMFLGRLGRPKAHNHSHYFPKSMRIPSVLLKYMITSTKRTYCNHKTN